MLTEQIYAVTNQCLDEVKKANIDHISQLRLECLFIRLKRHIISLSLDYPSDRAAVNQENILKLRKLAQQLSHAGKKDEAIAELERQVEATIKGLGPAATLK